MTKFFLSGVILVNHEGKDLVWDFCIYIITCQWLAILILSIKDYGQKHLHLFKGNPYPFCGGSTV